MEYLSYSDEDILERVDEYSLYCHYLGYKPIIGKKYHSPIREKDNNPSFGLFVKRYGEGTWEYLWTDNAIGMVGPKNIIHLVQFLYRYQTYQKAIIKICCDFGLGDAPKDNSSIQLITYEPKFNDPINIRIKSKPFTQRDLLYWKQYNITEALLNEYSVFSLDYYWMSALQPAPNYNSGLGFAYKIFNKYQLYFPFKRKDLKFRNNLTKDCIAGLQQCRNKDLLVITKAYKDIMMFRSFGIDALAPQGESKMIPKIVLQKVAQHYDKVITMFDNDGKHRASSYPFPETHIPIETGVKDPTDFCAKFGADETLKMINYLCENSQYDRQKVFSKLDL